MISCSPDHTCDSHHILKSYEVVESLDIPLEGNQYAFSHTVMNPFDGKLYGLDADNLILTAFELSGEFQIDSIAFDNQGPNMLRNSGFLSFNFIGKDSILFLNDIGEAYVFSTNGQRLFYSFLYDQLPSNEYANLNLINIGVPYSFHFPLEVDHKNNSFYPVPLWISNSYSGENLKIQYQKSPMAEFTIFKNSYYHFFGKYPYDLSRSAFPAVFISSFEKGSKGENLILFNASSQLFVDSIFYCVTSIFDNQNRLEIPANGRVSEEETIIAYHKEGGYRSIHYDRYRNLYYILYKHEVLTEDPHIMQSPFSIIVLNENFEVLGESEFPAKTYDFLHMHVIPKGILLLKENPYNPKNLEEFLEADIITINL